MHLPGEVVLTAERVAHVNRKGATSRKDRLGPCIAVAGHG